MNPRFHEAPPAIVCNAESFAELVKHVGEQMRQVRQRQRMNLAAALSVGRALHRLRPMTVHGEWGDTLEACGVSARDASEWMRGCELPADEQLKWETIQDLRDAVRGEANLTIVRNDDPPPDEGAEDSNLTIVRFGEGAAGALTPPEKPQILCPACERKGWSPSCAVCHALNSPGQATEKPSGPLVVWNWTTANEHLGALLSSVDTAAEAASAKGTDEHKQVREKYLNAKEATSVWIKKLRAEAQRD